MELRYIVLTIIKILISVPTVVLLLPRAEAAALMGGHLDNKSNSSISNFTSSYEYDFDLTDSQELGSNYTYQDEQEDATTTAETKLMPSVSSLESMESRVADDGEESEEIPDPSPLVVPGYNLPDNIFNKGKPFYLEKDPLTGAIDFNTKALHVDDDYEYIDEEPSSNIYDKANIDRKDGSLYSHKPSDVNQLTPNFHDFLNLPVKYNPDKYVYPLISSSYANTKIQGNVNKFHNHKDYTVTTYKPTISPTYYTTKHYFNQYAQPKVTQTKTTQSTTAKSVTTTNYPSTKSSNDNLMNGGMKLESYDVYDRSTYKPKLDDIYLTTSDVNNIYLTTPKSETPKSETPRDPSRDVPSKNGPFRGTSPGNVPSRDVPPKDELPIVTTTKRPMSLFEQIFGSDYEEETEKPVKPPPLFLNLPSNKNKTPVTTNYPQAHPTTLGSYNQNVLTGSKMEHEAAYEYEDYSNEFTAPDNIAVESKPFKTQVRPSEAPLNKISFTTRITTPFQTKFTTPIVTTNKKYFDFTTVPSARIYSKQKDSIGIQKDSVTNQKHSVSTQKDSLPNQKDSVMTQKDAISTQDATPKPSRETMATTKATQIIYGQTEKYVPKPTTDRSTTIKVTSLPLGENHVTHNNRQPIIVATQNLKEQLNSEKVGKPFGFENKPILQHAPSTSNIHIAPDQDTVSFVVGHHQSVDGGQYVGTDFKVSPYDHNPFRPLYGQVGQGDKTPYGPDKIAFGQPDKVTYGQGEKTQYQPEKSLYGHGDKTQYGQGDKTQFSQDKIQFNQGPVDKLTKNDFNFPHQPNKPEKDTLGVSAINIHPIRNSEASLTIGVPVSGVKIIPGQVVDETLEIDSDKIEFPKGQGTKIVFPDNDDETQMPVLLPPRKPIAPTKDVLNLSSKPMFHQLPSDLTPPSEKEVVPPPRHDRPRPPWDPRPGHFYSGRPEYARPPRPHLGPSNNDIYKRIDNLPNILPQFRPNMKMNPHHHHFANENKYMRQPLLERPSNKPIGFFEKLQPPPPPKNLHNIRKVPLELRQSLPPYDFEKIRQGEQNLRLDQNLRPLEQNLRVDQNLRPLEHNLRLDQNLRPLDQNLRLEQTLRPQDQNLGAFDQNMGPFEQNLRPFDQRPEQNLRPVEQTLQPRPQFAEDRLSDGPKKQLDQFHFYQTPPKLIIANRRNGDDDPEIETLQMIQAKHSSEKKEASEGSSSFNTNLNGKDSIEKPLYVVYPVNSPPLKLDAIDNSNKESVVIGTRAELPLPPSKIKQELYDNPLLNPKNRNDYPVLKPHPRPSNYPSKSDFPYAIERPDQIASVESGGAIIKLDSLEEQFHKFVSGNQWNSLEDDAEGRIVTGSKINAQNPNQISVTLKTFTEKPIAVAYTPTEPHPQFLTDKYSMPNYGSPVIPEIRPGLVENAELSPSSSNSEFTVSAIMHTHPQADLATQNLDFINRNKQTEANDRRKSDLDMFTTHVPQIAQQDFQAPFQASMNLDNMSQGWTVVRDKAKSSEETEVEVTTIPIATTSEFDIENFKPQLIGGFKPLYNVPEETPKEAELSEREE